MGVSKTCDHIQIKIKMPNPSQEPPTPSKAPNEGWKDMDVLCTFKIMVESQNLVYQRPVNISKSKSSQVSRVSSKAPNGDSMDMDALYTFNFKIGSQSLDHMCIKDQWTYPNQDQDAQTKSGASSVLHGPKWGLKGYGCSLHLQNQDREHEFGAWVYQRPVNIFI